MFTFAKSSAKAFAWTDFIIEQNLDQVRDAILNHLEACKCAYVLYRAMKQNCQKLSKLLRYFVL